MSCHRCGGPHLATVCKFKEAVCYACRKRGHIARVCRSKGYSKGRKSQEAHCVDGDMKDSDNSSDEEAYSERPNHCFYL